MRKVRFREESDISNIALILLNLKSRSLSLIRLDSIQLLKNIFFLDFFSAPYLLCWTDLRWPPWPLLLDVHTLEKHFSWVCVCGTCDLILLNRKWWQWQDVTYVNTLHKSSICLADRMSPFPVLTKRVPCCGHPTWQETGVSTQPAANNRDWGLQSKSLQGIEVCQPPCEFESKSFPTRAWRWDCSPRSHPVCSFQMRSWNTDPSKAVLWSLTHRNWDNKHVLF